VYVKIIASQRWDVFWDRVYIHFGGSCPLTKFCQLQNSLCIQVLRSPILSALLHGTRAAAISQTLWRGTMNGITERSQRAPPIFGWAAITLGIGPHSSLFSFEVLSWLLYIWFPSSRVMIVWQETSRRLSQHTPVLRSTSLNQLMFFMVALCNRADHYIFMLWFVLSSSSFFLFFPRLISAAADWMSAILPHMVWP